MSDDLPTPTPYTNPETQPFWDATAEGRLLLGHCEDCGKTFYYPRTICPECSSSDTELVEASGDGEIYSFTITHQIGGSYGDATPYVLAYVELEEGPRMMTNVVAEDPHDLEVGQDVTVRFDETDDEDDDYALPRFVPAD